MTRHVVALLSVTASLHCADGPAAETGGRSAVEVQLPPGGLEMGYADAPVVLVEFGAYACKYCRQFHRDLLPYLNSEYISRRQLRYRYIEVGPLGLSATLASIVECIALSVGQLRAQDWAFGFSEAHADSLSDASPLAAASRLSGRDSLSIRNCGDSTHTRRLEEREVAERIGALLTPTFIVGIEFPDGHVVGWNVVGMARDRILEAVTVTVKEFDNPTLWNRLTHFLVP